MNEARESLFAVGDKVVLTGGHPYAGRAGVIVNSPGKVFTGWTIRLDPQGHHVGASDQQMRKDAYA